MPPDFEQSRHDTTEPGYSRGSALSGTPAAYRLVRHVCWLSDDILLVSGWLHSGDGARPELVESSSLPPENLETALFTFEDRLSDTPDPPGRYLLLCRFPAAKRLVQGGIRLHLGSTDSAELSSRALRNALCDLRSLLRGGPSAQPSETRDAILSFLMTSLSWTSGPRDRRRLSDSMHLARQVLRQRLPRFNVAQDRMCGIRLDPILGVDETHFCVKGWLSDRRAADPTLTAVSPEGSRTVLRDFFRYPRPDLDQLLEAPVLHPQPGNSGFFCTFTLDQPSLRPNGWIIEVKQENGAPGETTAILLSDPRVVRAKLLGSLKDEPPFSTGLTLGHIRPALETLQMRLRRMAVGYRLDQYGNEESACDVSIIVLLGNHVDMLEHQLAQFVREPDASRLDLLYVLDAPEKADEVHEVARNLYQLYRMPFRVLTLRQPVGSALAQDFGASHAKGRLLVLMNPTILPGKAGWVRDLTEFYDSTSGIGALGPKILDATDKVLQAGIYLSGQRKDQLPEEMFRHRGADRYLAAVNTRRKAPAVSAGCLMISRDLFQRIGGFSGIYTTQDFQGIDLCTRLIELGCDNYYLPDVEMFDVEEQTPGPLTDPALWRYERRIWTQLYSVSAGAARA